MVATAMASAYSGSSAGERRYDALDAALRHDDKIRVYAAPAAALSAAYRTPRRRRQSSAGVVAQYCAG